MKSLHVSLEGPGKCKVRESLAGIYDGELGVGVKGGADKAVFPKAGITSHPVSITCINRRGKEGETAERIACSKSKYCFVKLLLCMYIGL